MLDGHFPHLLAWDNTIFVCENYEATTGYFPVLWKDAPLPRLQVGDSIAGDFCFFYPFHRSGEQIRKVDYIISWGDDKPNDCKAGLLKIATENYEVIYRKESPAFTLYALPQHP